MKSRSVIEIQTSSYEEEQYILYKIPSAVWIKLGEETRFYVPNDKLVYVAKLIAEWKSAENKKGKENEQRSSIS